MNRVENIVAKEEIAHYKQYLLLQQCFQNKSAAEAPKASVFGKGLMLAHFNKFAVSDFAKVEIAHNKQIHLLTLIMSWTLFNKYTLIYIVFGVWRC